MTESRSPLSGLSQAALLLILFLAAWLRLMNLGARGLWYDEIGQVLIAENTWWETITASVAHAGNTPLDYLITHFTLTLGRGEALLRMPAALFGVGSVFLTFWLARRLFGTEAALLAAFVLAIMPMHVRYSQEVRFYSVATFMALASVAAFWLAQESNSWGAWARFALVHAVGLYAHYYLMFVAVGLFLWVLLCRRQALWRFMVAAGAATLLFMPWIYFDNVVHGRKSMNLANARLRLYGGLPKLAVGPFVEVATSRSDLSHLPLPLWVYIYGAWALAAWGLVGSIFSRQRKSLLLVTLPLLTGFPGFIALDWYGNYPFSGRQTLIFLPFLVMAVSGVIFDVLGRVRQARLLRYAAVVAVGAASVLVLWPWIPSMAPATAEKTLVRLNRLLNAVVEEDDRIVVGYPDHISFYVQGLRGQMTHARVDRLDRQINDLAADGRVVWILGWGPNIGSELAAWGKQAETWDLSALAMMPVFAYAPDHPDVGLVRGLRLVDEAWLPEADSQTLRLALAKQLVDQERFEEALALIEPIQDWSTLGDADLVLLGGVYMAGQPAANWPKAREVYTLLLETSPNNWQAHYDLGRIATRSKQWTRVVELGEHILPYTDTHERNRAFTLRQLFKAYTELGDYARICELWPDVVVRAKDTGPLQRVVSDYGERVATWCGL